MKTVYFVRHGQGENNIEHGVYQGGDAPLTSKGVEEAHTIAKRAERLPVEVLISSTFLRTRQTAEIISEHVGKPVLYSELFIERRAPSSLVGMKLDDTATDDLHDEWERSIFEPNRKLQDGENFADIKARAIAALQFLAGRSESNIMVVTHGFFLRMMALIALFGDAATPDMVRRLYHVVRTSNTGITVFRKGPDRISNDTGWKIWVWNDHAHLG